MGDKKMPLSRALSLMKFSLFFDGFAEVPELAACAASGVSSMSTPPEIAGPVRSTGRLGPIGMVDVASPSSTDVPAQDSNTGSQGGRLVALRDSSGAPHTVLSDQSNGADTGASSAPTSLKRHPVAEFFDIPEVGLLPPSLDKIVNLNTPKRVVLCEGMVLSGWSVYRNHQPTDHELEFETWDGCPLKRLLAIQLGAPALEKCQRAAMVALLQAEGTKVLHGGPRASASDLRTETVARRAKLARCGVRLQGKADAIAVTCVATLREVITGKRSIESAFNELFPDLSKKKDPHLKCNDTIERLQAENHQLKVALGEEQAALKAAGLPKVSLRVSTVDRADQPKRDHSPVIGQSRQASETLPASTQSALTYQSDQTPRILTPEDPFSSDAFVHEIGNSGTAEGVA